jgi:hypothetical protein
LLIPYSFSVKSSLTRSFFPTIVNPIRAILVTIQIIDRDPFNTTTNESRNSGHRPKRIRIQNESWESDRKITQALGYNLIGTLALFASFQLRAFSAELIQWRIRRAAELVEILARPVLAVHTEMPKVAISFFAVSGLRRHTTFPSLQKKWLIWRELYQLPNLVINYT